jgi:ribonucleoside-diphosphate reductase alpha chain
VRLLDDLVEINVYPDAHIEQATRRTRKIGLGVMGVADLLLLQGLPYADARARSGMDELLAWVRLHAERASEELAQQRGVFPAHTRGFPARRNASLLAIAPTGILRLIAGCSGGMEPFLRPAQEVTGPRGTRRWVDRWLARWSRQHCADPEALWQALHEERDTADLPGVPDPLRPLLRRAWEIPPEAQLEMQARLQSHVDGAVSKTVHLASDATAAAIEPLIFRAHDSGCKGVSFYRRGASAAQAVALPFTGAPELDS